MCLDFVFAKQDPSATVSSEEGCGTSGNDQTSTLPGKTTSAS